MSALDAQVHQDAGDVEREAAERAASYTAALRESVLAAVAAAWPEGLTSLEAWRTVAPEGTPGQYSISPRLTELKDLGLVEPVGRRREYPDAPSRIVWRATAAGRAEAGATS